MPGCPVPGLAEGGGPLVGGADGKDGADGGIGADVVESRSSGSTARARGAPAVTATGSGSSSEANQATGWPLRQSCRTCLECRSEKLARRRRPPARWPWPCRPPATPFENGVGRGYWAASQRAVSNTAHFRAMFQILAGGLANSPNFQRCGHFPVPPESNFDLDAIVRRQTHCSPSLTWSAGGDAITVRSGSVPFLRVLAMRHPAPLAYKSKFEDAFVIQKNLIHAPPDPEAIARLCRETV